MPKAKMPAFVPMPDNNDPGAQSERKPVSDEQTEAMLGAETNEELFSRYDTDTDTD